MHQVEELCDRILLIDHGKSLLYGSLLDIQRSYAGQDILLTTVSDPGLITGFPPFEKVNGNTYRIVLPSGTAPREFLRQLVNQNVDVEQFQVAAPTLDEIFIQVVDKGEKRQDSR